jgi:hypothetical protein
MYTQFTPRLRSQPSQRSVQLTIQPQPYSSHSTTSPHPNQPTHFLPSPTQHSAQPTLRPHHIQSSYHLAQSTFSHVMSQPSSRSAISTFTHPVHIQPGPHSAQSNLSRDHIFTRPNLANQHQALAPLSPAYIRLFKGTVQRDFSGPF